MGCRDAGRNKPPQTSVAYGVYFCYGVYVCRSIRFRCPGLGLATLALGGCVRLSFVLGSGFLRSVGYSRGQKLSNGASRNTRCISRHRRDPGTCRFPTRPTGQRASLTGPRSSGAERRPLQRNAWNKRRRTTGRENTAAAGLGGGSARGRPLREGVT